MRVLVILIELLFIGGLITFAASLVAKIVKDNKKEKQWNKWKNRKTQSHNVNIETIKNDLEELVFVMQDRIPKPALDSLLKINETIVMLNSQPNIFSQWQNTYSEESNDLIDILYKHIPESLNRYFSVPSKFTEEQKHRNGKSANELLIETFHIFEQRFNNIAKEVVSENINKLKTYQAFLQDKYEEKEWQR